MTPAFARDFPRDPELDDLVAAFGRGNFRAVRDGAPALAQKTEDQGVKAAALLLLERTRPHPSAWVVFVIAALLLTFLTTYWVVESARPHPPPEKRSVEFVK